MVTQTRESSEMRPPHGLIQGSGRKTSFLSHQTQATSGKAAREYEYLRLGPNEYRLLVLLPGRSSTRIECSIYSTRFTASQEYQALSYHWGSDEANIPISINSEIHSIRPTLNAALSALRSPEKEVIIWVDVLCINQADREEKLRQVGLIPRVHLNASNVCIWLGSELPERWDAEGIFDWMRALLDFNKYEPAITPRNACHLNDLLQLLKREWFSSRWRIQDIAFAKTATVRYGSMIIAWEDFADAISLLKENEERVKNILPMTVHSSLPWQFGRAWTLVETVRNIFRRVPDGMPVEKRINIETLVSSLLNFQVADPRDAIYALLLLAKDSPLVVLGAENLDLVGSVDTRIIPKYQNEVSDVLIGFVEYCVEKARSLDLICRHWAPSLGESELLPSWILPAARSAFGQGMNVNGRLNGDSFVGVSARSVHNYNTAAGLPPHCGFGKLEEGRWDGVLTAKGILLDTVYETSPRLVGILPQECLELGGWLSNNPSQVAEELWQTLVAGRNSDGLSAPIWYRRAFIECLKHVTPNGDLEINTLISAQSMPKTLLRVLEQVRATTWNRRVVRTEGEKSHTDMRSLFGLAPADTKRGDMVVILFGCSVPVILREQRSVDGKFWKFIGEAYIHGIMDGEAVEDCGFSPPYTDGAYTFTLR